MKNYDFYRNHMFAAAAVMLLWCAAAFPADPVKTEGGLLQGACGANSKTMRHLVLQPNTDLSVDIYLKSEWRKELS